MRKNNIGTRSIKGKRFVNLRRRVLSAAIIAASQTAWVAPAMAGPEGGRVVDGAGSIGRDGRNTTIQQRTNRMVVDWDSYNVAADEVVTYVQPGRDSVALNRILSHSGSDIHGQINANGQVVLVNPHGVFFGENAQVNVGGLIASGMTVDVSDFMNGDFTFSAVDGAEGKVINQGLINAATGGSVTLLGKQVRNDGLISARLGAVNLAAGKEAVVTFDEAGLMGVRISKEILQDELGVDAAVLNTGEITTQGGRILLSASTSRDIFSQAVNRGDLQQATSAVVHEDGSFTLGGGADVVNTGTLNVSSADRGAGDIVVLGENITQAGAVLASTQSGTSGTIELHAAHTALLTEESLTAARAEGRGQGGQIKVLGHHVGLTDQATVDVSGAWGGGEVYIGGDYQGANPFMPNAWRSFVGDQVRIKANALADGDGGRIIVWADDITRFFGSIEGKGAGENGTGGFAEVSGKELLRFDGLADMRGPGGIGTLLLDPRDIIIRLLGDEGHVDQDVFFDGGDSDQDFYIRPATIVSNLDTGHVKLEATRNITVEQHSNISADSSHSLTLRAGKNIHIGSEINLGQGELYLTAGILHCGETGCYSSDGTRSIQINGALNTRGTIDIRAADNIILASEIGTDANPTSVSFRAGNDITIEEAGQITASAAADTTAISLFAGDTTLFSDGITVAPVAGGDGSLIVGGNLNSYGTADARGGNIFLNSSGELTLNGDVMTQGGHFTVGEPEGVRPSGFSMIGYTINTGTAYKNSEGGISRSSTGLDAGNITIYTSGSADLGVMSAALHYDTVDDSGGGNSIGAITVISEEDITLHGDLDFNDFGPRTTDGVRLGNASGESELSLTAGRNITLNGEIYDLWGDSRDALNIDLKAGATLTLNNNIYTSGGNFTASADEIRFGDEGTISTRFANGLEGHTTAEHERHGRADWSTGGNVTLSARTQMMLGKVVTHNCIDIASCTGNLTLSGLEVGEDVINPSITQIDNSYLESPYSDKPHPANSHLDIAGTTAINIGTGTATLDSENNKFHGAVSGRAGSLEIVNNEAGLTFGALTLTGDLTATAAGSITDLASDEIANIIQVDGLATFDTNENRLLLDNHAHQLSTVKILGSVTEVALDNGRSLEVRGVETIDEDGTVDVKAITTTGEAGKVDINVAGDLTILGAVSTRGVDVDVGEGTRERDRGEITLVAQGKLTVGELNASGGSGNRGRDGGSITLNAPDVELQGDIISQGSSGNDNSSPGASGNITIDGNVVIAPADSWQIVVDNTGRGDPAGHSGNFVLNGTLNGGDTFSRISINSGNITFNGDIGNSTELDDLIINTYGDVAFNTENFPQADRINVRGQASDHRLTAPDVAGEWRILWPDVGRLEARDGPLRWIQFTNMSTLVGSNFDDRFVIETIGDLELSIIANRNGGASNGTNVNTLVASNQNNTWEIYEGDESTLNGSLRFTGFNVLQGGGGTDHFLLSGPDLFTGTLNGGDGAGNSVESEFENGRWTLTEGYDGNLVVGGHELQFKNIQTLAGSGSDSLTGLNQNNVWSWTPDNGGSVAWNDPDAADLFEIDFSGMNHLIGGGAADRLQSSTANGTWVMTNPHQGSLAVSGHELLFNNMQTLAGSGSDSLTRHDQNNHWLITSSNGGQLLESDGDGNGGIENDNTTDFSGMSHLVGGSNSDHFVFGAEGAVTGGIDGGGAGEGVNNTIVGRNTNNRWEIGVSDGAQRGSITDVTLEEDGDPSARYLNEFTGIHSLQGGEGTDQFVYLEGADHIALDGGGGVDNSVDFSRLGAVRIRLGEGLMTSVTNIQTLIGGGDGFSLGVVNGNNRWELDDEYSGVLRHDRNDDGDFAEEYTFINFAELVGGTGIDTLVARDVDNLWRLNSSNGGTLDRLNPEETAGSNAPLTFSGMDHLIGGTDEDHFVLSGADLFTGTLNGGDGAGNSVESEFENGRWTLTEGYDGNLVVDGHELQFKNIQTLAGSGSDSLTGLDQENVWSWTPDNGGSVAWNDPDAADSFEIDFSGMNHLIGGGAADRLQSSTANGAWVMTDPHQGTLTVSGHELRFNNMQTLAGSGSDSLTRHDQNNHWLITSSNGGQLLESDGDGNGGIENGNTTNFSGMNHLVGGSNSDHFVFGAEGAVTGGIDGGGEGEGVNNTIVGRNTSNRWEIGVSDGAQRGSITDVTLEEDGDPSARYLNEFTGIHSLQGGEGTDQFVYQTGARHIALDGGGGTDNSVDFSRLGAMDVLLDEGPMTNVVNIQTLIGGGDGFSLGVVNGNNRWELDDEYSGVLRHDRNDDGDFAEEYTFINFAELVGGTGIDTLVARDVGNLWRLNSSNGGTLDRLNPEETAGSNAPLTFSGMDHLIGGTDEDHFVLSGADLFTGTLNGGDGAGNSVESEFANGRWTLTEGYDGNLVVGGHELQFKNIQTLAGSGSDSLTGLDQENVWSWTPDNGGSVAWNDPDAADLFEIDFSGMNHLIGGGAADRLQSSTANGAWMMTDPHQGTLTVSGHELRFNNMQALAGSGSDSLTRHDQNNHWLITSSNGGKLLDSGGIENDNTTDFSGMNHLIGGSDAEKFVLEALFSGILNGGENSTGNSIESNLDGGAWLLTGAMQGTLNNVLTFENIQTLRGGSGDDEFSLDNITRTALSSFSLIDGGTEGANTLDLTRQSDDEPLIIAVIPRLDEDAHLNVRGIHTLTAKNNNNGNWLLGPDINTTWTVTGPDKGTLEYTETLGDDNSIDWNMAFEGFANLLGGSKDDRFNVEDGPIGGDIDGGEGSNWLDYSASIGDVEVIVGVGGGNSSSISNIQGFIGNHNPDSANPFNSKLIVGNATADSFNEWLIALLDEHNSNEIVSDGINDGVYNRGEDTQFYFINFNQLVGGDGSDTFTFSDDGQLTGSIDGGSGANTINATGSNRSHTFSFSDTPGQGIFIQNINNVNANSAQGNTLLGANHRNQWRISGVGGGTLNEQIQFQGFDSLVGGSGQDQFVLSGLGRVGHIDGGGSSQGSNDTVQLEGLDRALSIGLRTSGADIQLENIDYVNATPSGGHILVGAEQNNTWFIDTENGGTLNNQLSFSGFTLLRGNRADDTFIITGDGVITGNIDGGEGGDNTLDLSGVTTGRALTIAQQETSNADFSVRNIIAINSRSGAEHTLVAGNQTNTWSITGTNAGELAGMAFNGMANLVGGQLDDTFVFSAAGDITGLIDGGGHETENTLDYSRVAGADIGLGKDDDFINIQHLIGDNISSTLRAADQNNHWSLSDGVNAGTLNGGLRFTGITNLVGGSTHDVFTVNGGALTGAIYAGKGSGALNLSIKPGTSGQLRFFGGEGDNQILVNGGGVSYKARYAVDTAGEESLSYTGASGVHYELLYRDVTEVRDNVFADTLELVGGSHTEELVLSGNRFSVPGYSDLRFHNKHNLTVAATSQNHLKLEGRLDIPGTFEVRNARVSQDDNQARIEARRLILTGVAGFGSEGQSVNTHVDEVDIRLGRADLYLSNLGSLSLNELSGSGTIRVETEGALNSARDLKHSGSTSFISRFSDITLTGDNLLSGDITLAASGNIILKNTRDTRLQGVQAHNLSLTSEGDITATGVLTVDGLTALAADGDISLVNSKNNLRELEIQQAENVAVHAGHWMDLSSVYSRGDVYTRTEGLKLSGGITANNFQFDAGEGTSVIDGQLNVSTLLGRAQGITVKKGISIDTIELDSRGGTLALEAELETLQSMALRGRNVDQMAAIISGADLRVSSNANYNQRADTTAREDLRVTAESDITMETGVLSRSQSGEIHYQAGNSIALGGLDASGSTVSLTASRGAISNINNSDVNVTADRLEMHAATGIGRQTSLLTDIHVLNAQTQTGRLALVNQADLQVDRMASNGNVRLSNRTGHIYLNTQDGPVFNTAESDALLAGGTLTGNYDLGTVVVEVPDGSLYGLGQAHAQKPDLVGREVIMLAPNGTVGSRNRPLVVYAKDLSSTIAGHTWPMWWAFDVRPNQVENDSGIPQELLDFASAGSHQMVEVESLEDINPAIFTEVRNYTYSNISVLLPPDQRYDDDDNQ